MCYIGNTKCVVLVLVVFFIINVRENNISNMPLGEIRRKNGLCNCVLSRSAVNWLWFRTTERLALGPPTHLPPPSTKTTHRFIVFVCNSLTLFLYQFHRTAHSWGTHMYGWGKRFVMVNLSFFRPSIKKTLLWSLGSLSLVCCDRTQHNNYMLSIINVCLCIKVAWKTIWWTLSLRWCVSCVCFPGAVLCCWCRTMKETLPLACCSRSLFRLSIGVYGRDCVCACTHVHLCVYVAPYLSRTLATVMSNSTMHN